jgi:hypothetical protein
MYQAPTQPPGPLRAQSWRLHAIIVLVTTIVGAATLALSLVLIERVAQHRIISSTTNGGTILLTIVSFGLVPGLLVGITQYAMLWRVWRYARTWLWGSVLGWTFATFVFLIATRMTLPVSENEQLAIMDRLLILGYAGGGALTGFRYWRVYRTHQLGSGRLIWLVSSGAGFLLAGAVTIVLLGIIGS